MLSYLFPGVDWETVEFIGFDLDGTLYDEFDFIAQVYRPIAGRIAGACGADEAEVFDRLQRRWLEKGSSYNRIFSEILAAEGADGEVAGRVVEDCLVIFRSYQPVLRLSDRARFLLNYMSDRYRMFLVTDGSSRLQQAKIESLGLGQWFLPGNIAISGRVGRGSEKPSTQMLGEIGVISAKGWLPTRTVYFGDREVDRLFAEAAGFRYIQVRNMFNVGKANGQPGA